jgi:GMP synthase-like glutamine amidotransferase
MKIGILLCGDVPITLIDEFGSYSTCLQSQYELNKFGDVSVYNVYQHQALPTDTNACDVYIIGGSPSGVNDDLDWVKNLTLFIQSAFRAKKKLFGICFGHQVINYALGGKVERTDKGWGLGVYDVLLNQQIGKLKAGQSIKLIAIHQDQVITPGTGFEVLAGNDFCPNYITIYQDQVLTVQGHPEFTAPFFNALLMQRGNKFKQSEIKHAIVTDESVICHSAFNHYVNEFLFS